ncbi:p10 [tvarminne orthoreovirus]|uniref:P10 n=1 Tax=tvarminne orthoreovirus TaxID=3071306 RepID=X5CC49_9REOV|nr:p10 [tvarminne orthoreovirus]
MPARGGGSCNGATSVFGSVHCQAAQNSAGGDLQATSTLTAYWPYAAAGAAVIVIAFVITLIFCCRARVKADIAKRLYRKELVALTTSKEHAAPPVYQV